MFPVTLKEFIQKISEAQLTSEMNPLIDFPRLLYHTQAEERTVKLVTDSAQHVVQSQEKDK